MSIKHETITVDGTVLYCDACRRRGPESAYDNADDCMEQAEMDGWEVGDADRCAECVKENRKPAPKKNRTLDSR